MFCFASLLLALAPSLEQYAIKLKMQIPHEKVCVYFTFIFKIW